MKLRTCCATAALAVLTAAALASGRAGADEEAATVTTKDAMLKLHKGPNAPLMKLKKELTSKSPKWKAVQEQTEQVVTLAESFSKNDPPRGDKASWEKLTGAYLKAAKDLDDAAQKKKLKPAQTAWNKINTSCMGCHQAHKGGR